MGFVNITDLEMVVGIEGQADRCLSLFQGFYFYFNNLDLKIAYKVYKVRILT